MKLKGKIDIEILRKNWLIEVDAHSEEINSIFFVGKSVNPRDIMVTKSFSVLPLLLPYCAKSPTCKFRYTEGCERCGLCDIGEAYQLAEEYRMKPFTIQNYEMLEQVLQSLKEQGCSAFIGTCCQTFLIKHRHDFERIGLPGVLIDIDSSTCYHLGKSREAYQGSFKNQTRLKLDLLRKVLDIVIVSDEVGCNNWG